MPFINLRVVDDIDVLCSINVEDFNNMFGHVEGFFQLCINNCEVGSYYHENPLRENEVGGEYIDYWLNKLLDVIIVLSNSEKYIAIKEIETINRWVEFQRIKDKIKLKVVIDRSNLLNELYITKPYDNFDDSDLIEETIDFHKFKGMVCNAVQELLNQINEINPALTTSKMMLDLMDKSRIALQ